MSNVKVCCRVRPQNALEKERNGEIITEFDSDDVTISIVGGEKPLPFTFDRVFPMDSTQQDIYDYSAHNIVEDVMLGYNGTLFAYGQTSSGKTFTMEGSNIEDEVNRGVIPRINENVFRAIMNAPENIEFTVKVSYLEVYLEKIRDLLNEEKDNLQVHQDAAKGVYVKGLTEFNVGSASMITRVMQRGASLRKVAHTKMNAESSRSHSVFMLIVSQTNLIDGSQKSGKLFLVDLAGSEKVGKTGASGTTLDEAKMINKSLSALGLVINALTDGKSKHIPYRDSKLTRLLQESLGGNSRTTMVLCTSPSAYNRAETISSLRFGMRAKKIQNKDHINVELSSAEMAKLIKKLEVEIKQYKSFFALVNSELEVWRNGSSVPLDQRVNMGSLLNASGRSRGVGSDKLADNQPSGVGGSTQSSNGIETDAVELLELQQRENELLDQLTESEKKNQSLLAEMNEMTGGKGQLSEIVSLNEELVAENLRLTTEFDEIKQRDARYKFDQQELEINIEKERSENVAIKEDMERLEETLRNAEREIETLRKHVSDDERERRLNRVVTEMSTPSAAVQDLEECYRASANMQMAQLGALSNNDEINAENIAELKTELLAARTSSKALEEQVSELNLNVADLTSIKTKLTEEISRIEENVSDARCRLGHTLTENDQLLDEITTLENKVAELESENFDLLEQIVEAEEDDTIKEDSKVSRNELVEKLQAMNEEVREQLSRTQTEIAILKADRVASDAHALQQRDAAHKAQRELTDSRADWDCKLKATSMRLVAMEKSRDDLGAELHKVQEELNKLKATNVSASDSSNGNVPNSETLAQVKNDMRIQMSRFDALKKALEDDLQSRCQKVVDLEISLDEARDQYNELSRTSGGTAQKKKLAMLERNLAQLTTVHKQLVTQNTTLKVENALYEKKLSARDDRINNLESLLEDANMKFDHQMKALHEEREHLQFKLKNTRRLSSGLSFSDYLSSAGNCSNSSNDYMSGHIAKPIRGGGAIENHNKILGRPQVHQSFSGSSGSVASAPSRFWKALNKSRSGPSKERHGVSNVSLSEETSDDRPARKLFSNAISKAFSGKPRHTKFESLLSSEQIESLYEIEENNENEKKKSRKQKDTDQNRTTKSMRKSSSMEIKRPSIVHEGEGLSHGSNEKPAYLGVQSGGTLHSSLGFLPVQLEGLETLSRTQPLELSSKENVVPVEEAENPEVVHLKSRPSHSATLDLTARNLSGTVATMNLFQTPSPTPTPDKKPPTTRVLPQPGSRKLPKPGVRRLPVPNATQKEN